MYQTFSKDMQMFDENVKLSNATSQYTEIQDNYDFNSRMETSEKQNE